MKKLEADLKKGKYSNIYLLYGTQSFLRLRFEKAIAHHFVPEDETINLTYFYGNKTDVNEVISLSDTMPFFSEKRVIVLEDTGFFNRSCNELADYIPELPDTTVLIFSEEKINNDLPQTMAVSASGCIAKFEKPLAEDIRKWVMGRLGREHRPITASALDLFLARCTDDMWQISNDLERLISYTFGRDGIRAEDVDAVCPPLPEDKIFQMIDAMLNRDAKRAIVLYKDLLVLGRDPLPLMRTQLLLMLRLKEMNPSPSRIGDVADILGVKEGRAIKALSASKKRSKIYFTEGITKCADLEEQIKSSMINATIGVEALIIELSS